MDDWFFILTDQLTTTSYTSWVIVLLGACQALLARSKHIWLYPFGIVGTSLALFSLLGTTRYADMVFCMYFLAMYIYGWSSWSAGDRKGSSLVSYAQGEDWRIASVITGLAFIGLYMLLALTDSVFPIWQAAIGATLCASLWFLNKRKIEHWVLLNISQALAIPLLFHGGQYLYGIFAFLLYAFAFSGFFTWRRIIHQQRGFLQL